jgi:hypothetical protein
VSVVLAMTALLKLLGGVGVLVAIAWVIAAARSSG